jgi:hypothetical protein
MSKLLFTVVPALFVLTIAYGSGDAKPAAAPACMRGRAVVSSLAKAVSARDGWCGAEIMSAVLVSASRAAT